MEEVNTAKMAKAERENTKEDFINMEELNEAVKRIKIANMLGTDNVGPEFIKYVVKLQRLNFVRF